MSKFMSEDNVAGSLDALNKSASVDGDNRLVKLVTDLARKVKWCESDEEFDASTIIALVRQHDDSGYESMLRLSAILDKVNVSLKGESPEFTLHSYHDIPELVEKLASGIGIGWISVSDRLPDDGVEVQGYDFEHDAYAGSCIRDTDNAGGYWIMLKQQDAVIFVTHWQPLPSPPDTKEKV